MDSIVESFKKTIQLESNDGLQSSNSNLFLDTELYVQLFYTAAFVTGVFQTAMGIFRLRILGDFLSRSTITRFMGGMAILIMLQQLKGMLGMKHFTQHTNVISILHAVFMYKSNSMQPIDRFLVEEYLLDVLFFFNRCYNPLERREGSKGGKEAQKKPAPSQASSKSSAASRNQSSHTNDQKNEGNATHVSSKRTTKASSISGWQAYGEQITELKLFMDNLKKERDFYFAKLRDIETLSQSPE